MKKSTPGWFLILAVLLSSLPATAQEGSERGESASRAVNINIGSSGGGLDNNALQDIRKLLGKAVASGTVDDFVVFSPRVGGPIPIEGGLSACAEKGFNASETKFAAFVSQLHSIHPRSGPFSMLSLRQNANRRALPFPSLVAVSREACVPGRSIIVISSPVSASCPMRKASAKRGRLFAHENSGRFAVVTAKPTGTPVPQRLQESRWSTRGNAKRQNHCRAVESQDVRAPRAKPAWMTRPTIATRNAAGRIARADARANNARPGGSHISIGLC